MEIKDPLHWRDELKADYSSVDKFKNPLMIFAMRLEHACLSYVGGDTPGSTLSSRFEKAIDMLEINRLGDQHTISFKGVKKGPQTVGIFRLGEPPSPSLYKSLASCMCNYFNDVLEDLTNPKRLAIYNHQEFQSLDFFLDKSMEEGHVLLPFAGVQDLLDPKETSLIFNEKKRLCDDFNEFGSFYRWMSTCKADELKELCESNNLCSSPEAMNALMNEAVAYLMDHFGDDYAQKVNSELSVKLDEQLEKLQDSSLVLFKDPYSGEKYWYMHKCDAPESLKVKIPEEPIRYLRCVSFQELRVEIIQRLKEEINDYYFKEVYEGAFNDFKDCLSKELANDKKRERFLIENPEFIKEKINVDKIFDEVLERRGVRWGHK